MIRIFGHNFGNHKQIGIALTDLYGIGLSLSKKLLTQANIAFAKKVNTLSDLEITTIREMLEKITLQLEGNLKRTVDLNIKRLIDINSYRGRRHLRGLPVRGQRTRTNSRTARKSLRFHRKGA